jgi:hypothetical protein
MGCADPVSRFNLRNSEQSANSRFCSHTVHAPEKLNSLRSHSMASKPGILRRAVWKDQKPPIRVRGPLDPEVITLDPLPQVFTDVMERSKRSVKLSITHI